MYQKLHQEQPKLSSQIGSTRELGRYFKQIMLFHTRFLTSFEFSILSDETWVKPIKSLTLFSK